MTQPMTQPMTHKPVVSTFARLALALPVLLALASHADARAGGGGSFGSRGSRTFSAPPPTATAPRAAEPIQRSVTQPAPAPAPANQGLLRPAPVAAPAASGGGFFSGGFGRGLLGGFAGAGLFGLLTGSGLTGGMGGGIMSFIGLLLQIGLIFLVVRLAMGLFRRKPALAGAGGLAGGVAMATAPMRAAPRPVQAAPAPLAKLAIDQNDYNTFEQRLGDIETAYGNEDMYRLRDYVTPEMASHFERELADNASRGVINRIGSVQLLQGDLSECWRDADAEYATLAMRYGLIDATFERATNKLVAGNDNLPQEAREVWTFRRPPGANAQAWKLSAIQQA